MAGDDVRRLSEELARDPSSLAFLRLGEILRRQQQLEMAHRIAIRGLERHPHNPEAHDLLARIEMDRGETQKAFDEWDMVLRLAPGHAGASKGMGLLCYMQGQVAEAEQYLAAAAQADPDDEETVVALEHVRERLAGPSSGEPDSESSRESMVVGEPGHESSGEFGSATDDQSPHHQRPTTTDQQLPAAHDDTRHLFSDLTSDGRYTALLLDPSGLVLAGAYITADGHDAGQEVGAELSGVSDEAGRAMRHLDLGEWESIVLETDGAIVAMAPAPDGALLVVAADRATPLGYVRRELERAAQRSRAWLEREAR